MEQQIFGGSHVARAERPVWESIKRGMLGKCPRCGSGKLFASFLKTVDHCEVCGEEIHHHRADDLPAYLTLVVIGHVIIGAFMGVEAAVNLSLIQHLLIWVPVTILASLALLRPIKGGVVGLQWALMMHGFGGEAEQLETHPEL